MTEKLIDPRQALCISYYKNPASETFANLQASAERAGFEKSYSRTLTAVSRMPEWVSDSLIQDVKMVQRAERNLKKYIELDVKISGKKSIDIAKLQVDVSKFILKTLAKQKYSEDAEHTPPNVQINIVNYADKAKAVVDADKARDVTPE